LIGTVAFGFAGAHAMDAGAIVSGRFQLVNRDYIWASGFVP